MPMTSAYLGAVALPLDFAYYLERRARISVSQTLTADVVQTRDYYEGDTYYSFSCNYVSSTVQSAFLVAFKAQVAVTFKDYDGSSISVLITEFSDKEEAGYYNISGKMKVIPA